MKMSPSPPTTPISTSPLTAIAQHGGAPELMSLPQQSTSAAISAPTAHDQPSRRPASAQSFRRIASGAKVPKRRQSSRTLPVNKNLRAISLSLVAKVRSREAVTSTEIANELAREAVAEIAGLNVPPEEVQAVEKNIRRRLYDSLKVLVSVGAISRSQGSGKLLMWNGVGHLLPGPGHPAYNKDRVVNDEPGVAAAAASCVPLRRDLKAVRERLSGKQETLRALQEQQQYMNALYERNCSRATPGRAEDVVDFTSRISLPFVVVRTPAETEIELESSDDAQCMYFRFSESFQVINDSGILERVFKTSPLEALRPGKRSAGGVQSIQGRGKKLKNSESNAASPDLGTTARGSAVVAEESTVEEPAAKAETVDDEEVAAAEAAAISLLALSPATPLRKRGSMVTKSAAKARRRLFPPESTSPLRSSSNGPSARRLFAPAPQPWDPLGDLELEFFGGSPGRATR